MGSTVENSRAPSRVGSIYSEWSDCTLPDYPDSVSGMSVQNYDQGMPAPPFQQQGYQQHGFNQQPQGYQQQQNFQNPMRQMQQGMQRTTPQHNIMQQQQPKMPVIPVNGRPNPPPMFPLLGPNYEVHNLPQQNGPFGNQNGQFNNNYNPNSVNNPYHSGQIPRTGYNNPPPSNRGSMFNQPNMQPNNWLPPSSNYPSNDYRGRPRHSGLMDDEMGSVHSERGRSQYSARASSRGRSKGRSNSRTRARRQR